MTGVRGVAAIIIVIYHYGKFHLDHVSDVWDIPHGYLPVDLFFMLSEYVIGYVYRDNLHPEFSSGYGNFLVRDLHGSTPLTS